MSVPGDDRWAEHRSALLLTGQASDDIALGHSLDRLRSQRGDHHADFLVSHGLAGWWLQQLTAAGVASQIPSSIHEKLVDARRAAMAMYLAQSHAIVELASEFEKRGIVYALFKGAAVRDEAYATPWLRTAGDVDMLVSATARQEAIECLASLGFTQSPGVAVSAHELTLTRGRVDIDLHWDILRPGRTRRPLVDALLAQRVRSQTFWRLSDSDTVFMMLVHPAITKYVCSANMGLNRVLDFVLFTRTRPIEWARVTQRLDEAGLRTAAWCTLRWINLLDPPDSLIPHDFQGVIAPGSIRKAYLNLWLIHDLPGRLLNRADWLIRAAFTLPMHDQASGVWRALRALALKREPEPRGDELGTQ